MNSQKRNFLALVVATCVFGILVAIPANSAAPLEPDMIKVASYEVGGSAYSQWAAIGEATLKKFNIRLRVFPCGSGLARLYAIRTHTTDIVGTGFDLVAAQEGMYDFSTIEWGPQPIRIVWQTLQLYPYSMATRADSGIKNFADLKGKKLPSVIGSPDFNGVVQGSLAWAGLTYDDVKLVEVRSTVTAYKALLDGTVDASPLTGLSTPAYQLESGPHGLFWIPMPKENKEGWKRFREYSPTKFPVCDLMGAGLREGHGICLATYAFPTTGCYADLDDATAYWATKAIYESYDLYKGAIAVMPGWKGENALERLPCILPWHEGSIKYLKEKGLWTDRLERNQKELLERQSKLQTLWEKAVDEMMAQGIKGKAFPNFWTKKRAEVFPGWYKEVR